MENINALDAEQRKRKDTQVPEAKRLKLTPRQKAAAALKALRDVIGPVRFDYSVGKANLDAIVSPDEIESFLNGLRRDAYNNVLSDWNKHVNAASR